MKKTIVVLLLLIFYLPYDIFALDWKRLHEEADKKDIKEALASMEKSIDSLDDLYILGLVYLNNRKDTEAQETFKNMLAIDPGSVEAQWGLAEALRRKKETQESGDLLVNIIKSNPEFSPAYISLAYLKYTQADFKEAVRLTQKVKKQGRNNVDLSNYVRAYAIFAGAKGMIASRGGPFSKLINGTQILPNLKKAEKLQPDSGAVLFGLGSFYFLAPRIAGGDVDKASEYLEKAIAADPLFADAYVRLAQIQKSKGDDKKYKFYINKALEIDPDNELAKDEIAGICKFNCVTVKE